jgi:hypothetical protein
VQCVGERSEEREEGGREIAAAGEGSRVAARSGAVTPSSWAPSGPNGLGFHFFCFFLFFLILSNFKI